MRSRGDDSPKDDHHNTDGARMLSDQVILALGFDGASYPFLDHEKVDVKGSLLKQTL